MLLMSSCCHNQQWALSAPSGAVSLPLVNPSLPFLPTCHFSCATETQLDLNLIARGLGCLHKFHLSGVHCMSGIGPDTFSGLFHLILMGTPSLEMKRLIQRLFAQSHPNGKSEKCDLNWLLCPSTCSITPSDSPGPEQSSRLLLTYTRCQLLRNVAL